MSLPLGPAEVAHGFTLDQVARIAGHAVELAPREVCPLEDRRQAAWHGVVEALLSSATPPTARELVGAGVTAVQRHLAAERHHHGRRWVSPDVGVRTMAAYVAYWNAKVTPSPENRIVERLALKQILSALTPAQRRVLQALAATGDPAAAAALAGLEPGGFKSTLRTGRQRFLALWHEGERPSRVWGVNRPGRRGRKTMHDLLRQRARYRQASPGASRSLKR